jgi:predicted nucleic acid-binding protein
LILDSGGVSGLASDRDVLARYLRLLGARFDGSLLIPIPVLTEVRTGHRSSGALLERLIKAIGAEDELYLPLDVAAATRAGLLRASALAAGGRIVSTTDAQVVALAEQRSYLNAVTIITGDLLDIGLLVDLTRRPNIAVDVI